MVCRFHMDFITFAGLALVNSFQALGTESGRDNVMSSIIHSTGAKRGQGAGEARGDGKARRG